MTDELIETGSFARSDRALSTDGFIRVVTWNIDRGAQVSRVIEALRTLKPDLALLQEVDHRAKRTGCRNVASEIAEALEMHYVFGSEFQELAQGCSEEPAFHGQATLSRWPIASHRILRFTSQSKFWQPRWFIPRMRAFQRRAGGRMALIAELALPGISLVTYNLHLESRGELSLRSRQLEECLRDAGSWGNGVPVLMAGDFNCDLLLDPVCERLKGLQIVPKGTENRQVTTHSQWRKGQFIDWILVSAPVAIVDCAVHREFSSSDHLPISLTIQVL